MTCPGCGGPISRGAMLCRECRKRAIVAGVNLLAPGARGRDARKRTEAVTKRTSGQNRAYHGKANTLARLTSQSERAVKDAALEQASMMFGREITSSRDLSEDEMSDLLDRLDNAIAAAEADR